MRLLKTFVNSAAELLGFIELSIHCLLPATTDRASVSNSASLNKKVADCTILSSPWEHVDVKDALNDLIKFKKQNCFHDEASHAVWPPQEDVYLNTLLVKYAHDVGGPYHATVPGDTSTLGVTSHPAGIKASPYDWKVWTAAAVGQQISMLWVMHLRALCSLRGVKPTEVLGVGLQQWMKEFREGYAVAQQEDIVSQCVQSSTPVPESVSNALVHVVMYLIKINYSRKPILRAVCSRQSLHNCW